MRYTRLNGARRALPVDRPPLVRLPAVGYHLDVFHPETDELLLSIPLTADQRQRLAPVIEYGPGEQAVVAFFGEHELSPITEENDIA